MSNSPADIDNAGHFGAAPRKLGDAVFDSAAEDLLARPPVQLAEAAGKRALMPYRDAMARHVARKPWQSALIAAAAGAAAAALLRSAMRRRQR
jgi:hypothetical protein